METQQDSTLGCRNISYLTAMKGKIFINICFYEQTVYYTI